MISYTKKNRTTVNYLKSIYFDYPQWTPFQVELMPATWMKYRRDLEEIVLAHPRVFPGYTKGSLDFDFTNTLPPLYEPGRHTDCWGTVWENVERGLDSYPIAYPLENWTDLARFHQPDPLKENLFGPWDWDQISREFQNALKNGNLATARGLPHGFMYMRLYYLRRFENLMMDMAMDEPRLQDLISIIENYNQTIINKYLRLGAEMLDLGDDLGLQHGLPVSPQMWCKFIKPSYSRMLAQCREKQIPVRLHTDGHILEIIPDLIEAGVTLLNPQFRANGLPGLKEIALGRVALHLDLDRQFFPFASPSEIEEHIGSVFETLFRPEGGLMIYAECEPDVPLENIDAICTQLEIFCNPPSAQ